MNRVTQTIEEIIEVEGGYVDHPLDRGGPTKYGITHTTARAFGYQGDLKELPRGLAIDIYIQRYWIEPRFDQVAWISEVVAFELLDTGINMGQTIAARFLQRALNVLNREAADYPDITVDGVIGSMTLHALKSYLLKRGKVGESVLLQMLNAQQSVRYMEIAEKNPSQEAFEFGWQRNRVQ